ncbi:MAG: hypothetical protein M3220_12535 [Chloroflexota bacterium]|nr:hypothetical protein [Chloroflexota bacterium]
MSTEKTLLEILNDAWLVLTPEGQSLGVISPVHAEGVVAPVYSNRDMAEEVAQSHSELGEFAPYPMPPLWEAARLLATQGFAGMIVDERIPLFFVTVEPSSELPTHVAIPKADDFQIVDEVGETPLGKANVALWNDPEAFDQQSIAWVLRARLPFAGYEENMPLFEYLPRGRPQPVDDKGALLEEAEAVQDAVALFSSAFAAEWYWSVLMDEASEEEAREAIVAHHDVVSLLETRARPHRALILNPSRHRFYQGFFRQADERWYLVTINGVWRIEPPFRCIQVARRQFRAG